MSRKTPQIAAGAILIVALAFTGPVAQADARSSVRVVDDGRERAIANGKLKLRIRRVSPVRTRFVGRREGSHAVMARSRRVRVRGGARVSLRFSRRARGAVRRCQPIRLRIEYRAHGKRRRAGRVLVRRLKRCSTRAPREAEWGSSPPAAAGPERATPNKQADVLEPAPVVLGPEPEPRPEPQPQPEPEPEPSGELVPPPLSNATSISVSSGFTHLRLATDRDYVIDLPPERKLGGLTLEGGRNILISGGHISVPASASTDMERRAIYVKGATGTVHIEGVLVDNPEGSSFDAIAIAAPEALVQVQDVRAVGLRGSFAGFHADVIQPWGGVRELRVHRLTGESDYQGLFLRQGLGPVGPVTLDKVDLRATGDGSNSGGFMLWLDDCSASPTALNEVYVTARTGKTLENSVWPPVGEATACPGISSGVGVEWPGLPVSGVVQGGLPPGGEFVPAGVAGATFAG